MKNKNTKTFILTKAIKEKVIAELTSLNLGTKANTAKEADRHFYVVHRLLSNQLFVQNYKRTHGTPMSTEALFDLFKRKNYGSQILTNLQKWGIIKMVKQYDEGQSRRFCIADEYSKDSIIYYIPSPAPFVKRLIERETKNQTAFIRHQLKMLKRTSLSPEGIKFVMRLYPALKEQLGNYNPNVPIIVPEGMEINPKHACLISFLTKDFFATRPDKLNRIFTNFSCIKGSNKNGKAQRPFILLDGKELFSSDINNSQVLFSVPLVEKKLKQINPKQIKTLPADFYEYKRLSEQGKIYETLYNAIDIEDKPEVLEGDLRSAFKQDYFFPYVFFCEAGVESGMANIFKSLFPNVYKAIEQIKKDKSYNQFAINCQRNESRVMIDLVLKKLIKMNIPCLLLHDAIYTNNEADMKIVTQLIQDELYNEFKLKTVVTSKPNKKENKMKTENEIKPTPLTEQEEKEYEKYLIQIAIEECQSENIYDIVQENSIKKEVLQSYFKSKTIAA